MKRLHSIWDWMKNSFFAILLLLGVITMKTTDADATSYDLKRPDYYFKDKAAVTLLTAALSGDLSKAKEIVVQAANPNEEGPKDNPYNRLRLLHYAIAANNPTAVKILMAVGADPEMPVQGNGRAFLFAMTLNNLDMLSLLLELRPLEKLSPDTIDYLLFSAVTDNRPRCLELFLSHGAPIDFRDGAGYTVLLRAMDTQDYDMARWLLEKGASVNIETGNGVTPAYSVEFHLNKFKPGSPTYNKVLHLKKMMEERGAVFPALSPAEVRAKRGKQ